MSHEAVCNSLKMCIRYLNSGAGLPEMKLFVCREITHPVRDSIAAYILYFKQVPAIL